MPFPSPSLLEWTSFPSVARKIGAVGLLIAITVAVVALSGPRLPQAAGDNGIYVNGTPLTPETVRMLHQLYPVPLSPGRYWYDAVSGAWGMEGAPIAGRMQPWLKLGGPLQADASGGTSGVFINGRQLTGGEKNYLERMCRTPVMPGRYWVNAQGVGGYEGMAPVFNLAYCGGGSGGSTGGSSTRTYCDDQGNCSSHGLWGSVITGHD